MIQIITKTQYSVGGYVYDDEELAKKLDALLSENPDSKICPTCKGTRKEEYMTTESTSDSNGYPSGHRAVKKIQPCSRCKTGILVKVVTETWK